MEQPNDGWLAKVQHQGQGTKNRWKLTFDESISRESWKRNCNLEFVSRVSQMISLTTELIKAEGPFGSSETEYKQLALHISESSCVWI